MVAKVGTNGTRHNENLSSLGTIWHRFDYSLKDPLIVRTKKSKYEIMETSSDETTPPAKAGERMMAKFCEKFVNRSRGFLIPHAAYVVMIARVSRSTRLTAEFLSEEFGRKISRRPVADILASVKRGDIVVTAEDLAMIAKEHPYSEKFVQMFPTLTDPRNTKVIVDEPEGKRTAAAKKTAAKKKAAVAEATAGEREEKTKPAKPNPKGTEQSPLDPAPATGAPIAPAGQNAHPFMTDEEYAAFQANLLNAADED